MAGGGLLSFDLPQISWWLLQNEISGNANSDHFNFPCFQLFCWLSISLYLYNSWCFLFCIGHAWTTDYGCSDKEEEFQWLIKYGCSDFLLFPTSLYTIWVAALLLYRHWTDYWAVQKIIKPHHWFFFKIYISIATNSSYADMLIKGY
jgi:hypothetical protein